MIDINYSNTKKKHTSVNTILTPNTIHKIQRNAFFGSTFRIRVSELA
jgi:hypothetical protein